MLVKNTFNFLLFFTTRKTWFWRQSIFTCFFQLQHAFRENRQLWECGFPMRNLLFIKSFNLTKYVLAKCLSNDFCFLRNIYFWNCFLQLLLGATVPHFEKFYIFWTSYIRNWKRKLTTDCKWLMHFLSIMSHKFWWELCQFCYDMFLCNVNEYPLITDHFSRPPLITVWCFI